MKTSIAVLVFVALAFPASAAVIHDESFDGDLSSAPAAPTPVVFSIGGNTIIGTVSGVGTLDRDYITFTIAAGQSLAGLNLAVFSPDNLAFAAFNAGTTSYKPSTATDANFLAGILVGSADAGTDLMPLFVSRAVTVNSLPAPNLGPGDYCFIIQQQSLLTTSYELEFVVEMPVPVEESTWGKIKALYE